MTRLLAVLPLLLAAPAARAQESKLSDITPYLMDRNEETALARSAAPWGLGNDAAIWVLGAKGYEKVSEGSNGFNCFVGRGWSGPILARTRDGKQVLNPDTFDRGVRAPHCFNTIASESILPWHFLLTNSLIQGVPAERLHQVAAAALKDGRLKVPAPQAFAYMTSSKQHLSDRFENWRPHIMLYLPYTSNKVWGSQGFNHDYPSVVEAETPWAVAVIPIGKFADGTRPTWQPVVP
jgi:hypothetical protein